MYEPNLTSFRVTNYRYDEPKTEFKSEDIRYRFEYGWSQWIEDNVYWIQLGISMILKDGTEPFSRIITRTYFNMTQVEFDTGELLEYHTDCMVLTMRLTQAALLNRQTETKADGMRMKFVDRDYLLNRHKWLLNIKDSGFRVELFRKSGLTKEDAKFKDEVITALRSLRSHKLESVDSPISCVIEVTYRYNQTLIAWQKIDRLYDKAPIGLSMILGDIWNEEDKGDEKEEWTPVNRDGRRRKKAQKELGHSEEPEPPDVEKERP